MPVEAPSRARHAGAADTSTYNVNITDGSFDSAVSDDSRAAAPARLIYVPTGAAGPLKKASSSRALAMVNRAKNGGRFPDSYIIQRSPRGPEVGRVEIAERAAAPKLAPTRSDQVA
jgi:hypothetical protein